MADAPGLWIVERLSSERFPYRLTIVMRGEKLLVLRAQALWPGAGQNVFCLREDPARAEPGEEVERVAIRAAQRRGVRLTLVLDRAQRKRCDFIIVRGSNRARPEEPSERVYWQTQTSMAQRRPRVSIPASKPGSLKIAIAADEKYPWRFSGSETIRRRLDCGDYALLDGDSVIAAVERKTFDNLLGDFGVMPVLHQRLLELSQLRHAALVIEAPYEDFLSPAKLHHYTPAFCARALAELHAAHPSLQITFCANRKVAAAWTASYFAAVQASRSPVSDMRPRSLTLPLPGLR